MKRNPDLTGQREGAPQRGGSLKRPRTPEKQGATVEGSGSPPQCLPSLQPPAFADTGGGPRLSKLTRTSGQGLLSPHTRQDGGRDSHRKERARSAATSGLALPLRALHTDPSAVGLCLLAGASQCCLRSFSPGPGTDTQGGSTRRAGPKIKVEARGPCAEGRGMEVFSCRCTSHRWQKGRSISQSVVSDCDPMDCSPPVSPIHGIFQARVGCHSLLQGSNLGLLHYRQILHHLSHQGSRRLDTHYQLGKSCI